MPCANTSTIVIFDIAPLLEALAKGKGEGQPRGQQWAWFLKV